MLDFMDGLETLPSFILLILKNCWNCYVKMTGCPWKVLKFICWWKSILICSVQLGTMLFSWSCCALIGAVESCVVFSDNNVINTNWVCNRFCFRRKVLEMVLELFLYKVLNSGVLLVPVPWGKRNWVNNEKVCKISLTCTLFYIRFWRQLAVAGLQSLHFQPFYTVGV